MTDQYKQNEGDQSEKSKVEWAKPASLLNVLSNKFESIAKLQHMQLPSWSLLVFFGDHFISICLETYCSQSS